MKKRLLSALLALALVFVLLPTTALADTTPVTDENVKINGTPVTVGNGISLGEGNGTYSYDKSTRTLTLNNATITATGSNIGIDFCDTTNYVTYSVILTGENTVTSNNIAIETTPNTNLTFTGGGNLKAITNGYYQAIRVYGTLTIDNSTLIAESSAYTATTVIWTLAMTGNNAKLEISNKSAANIVAGTAGPASNIDWSNYQFTTGSYSGDALTESDPEVCSWGTLKEYLGFPTKKYSQYICIAKRTIPAIQRTSDVFIAGKDAVVGQWTTITADSCSGSYYYDADKKELTLKDVNITYSKGAIVQFMAGAPYIIKLEGTNSIKDVSSFIRVPENAYESLDGLSVTISGAGSLEVIARGNAITMLKGNLIFNNTGAIALETTTINGKAINVSGDISIGSDFNKNLKITADNGAATFDPTIPYTDYNDLKNYKSISFSLKDSTISYGDTTLKQGEIIKGEISGTATVATKGNTITLNNFKGDKALVFNAESTPNSITLIGDSTLSAVETKYQSLTISGSGSGSLTVGSIKVHKEKSTSTTGNTIPNLTINGATVTVGNAEITDRAIDIDGDLTVTNGSLTATSNSTKPTVQVGGNASFTGSTVTITNNSTALHKDAAGSTKGDSVSSALYVKGNINTDNANVTAKVENGGGNAIGALGNITVKGSSNVTAVNKGQKFTTIIAENVYVSGDSKITANNLNENPVYNGSYLAFPAIEGNIVNQNTDYSLKFEGQHNGTSVPKTTLAPGEQTTLYYYNVTITRGDEVTRTNSPVVIAGTTLLNDTYYTITNGSKVAEGTDSNYNAFYDSETKTLKLNNAKISTTTNNAAIKIGEDAFATYTITVTGTNELQGNYNHCIESYSSFKINGDGTLEMTNGSNTTASVIYCGPDKSLTIGAEVIFKNNSNSGVLLGMVEKDAYSFAEGYNVYASTNVSGSPLEAYDAAKGSTYKYLRVTKENLAPTTPTTYTVTITAGDNMKIERESGALTQEVTKGAAITEVKFMAASGHYFPADYVSKMNLPAGLTAEIRENSWYLIISGTPTSDVTINLPAASVRPTITVSMPTPAAGNTPATASDITLTYSDINKSISKNLTISNVVWQSYVPNGDGSITPGEALSSGDKFEAGKTYFVRITHEYVAGDYDIVPAAGITLDYTESDSTYMMLLFYTTGAPCNHEYTNDWLANGNTHWHECKLCRAHAGEVAHTFGDWITDTPATDTTDGSKHRTCSVCQYQENATIPKTGTGEIVPPTPDNPGTIVIIRPAEEEKPAQQPNPSTGANDLVVLAVAAAVAAALGSAALLRKHD